MTVYHIKKFSKHLHGEVLLPASKSETNRALIINYIMGIPRAIDKSSHAHDNVLMKKCLDLIHNPKNTLPKIIDCEDAGTVARFLTTYCSLYHHGTYIITGTPRLCERPIKPLIDSLIQLGAQISYMGVKHHLPIKITPPNKIGTNTTISCGISSQFISSLALIAPALPNGLSIEITETIASKPYLDMTLSMLKSFGADYSWDKNKLIIPAQTYKTHTYNIEADWSAAAFWYQMAALSDSCHLKLYGLKQNSLQGDSILAEIYKSFGINTHFQNDAIILTKGTLNPPLPTFDFKMFPDIFPSVVLTAILKKHCLQFSGIENIAHKESNRVKAVLSEIKKLIPDFTYTMDNKYIILDKTNYFTGKQFEAVPIDVHNDHRIAMAFAACSLIDDMYIENPDVVQKSYPHFWQDMKALGFEINTL